MKPFFVDLHIHVGINEQGKWVKIPTSRKLTVRNILHEAIHRKGMDVIGIVDALSPSVASDLQRLFAEGLLTLLPGGGYRYTNQGTILLGAEIETAERDGGLAHTLVFLPDLASMERFSEHMSRHIRNIHISSQNAHMPLSELIETAAAFEGLIIPAHIFTPHKSLYGSCTNRLSAIVSDGLMGKIAAVELGLSSDTSMADRIDELHDFSFVTNSDAHSLDKIAREYSIIMAEDASFQEMARALARQEGRRIAANYGLNPRLGKYHRTCCAKCGQLLLPDRANQGCAACGSVKIIRGVADRIHEIADRPIPDHPAHRPPYYYQIPLEFIPGVGGKTVDKLLSKFGTEMNVIHQATVEELTAVVGAKTAGLIVSARAGTADIIDGGGGVYGRLDIG